MKMAVAWMQPSAAAPALPALLLLLLLLPASSLAQGTWAAWGSWNSCSKTCDQGVQWRTRLCNLPYRGPHVTAGPCHGSMSQTRSCQRRACFGWSSWASWSDCVDQVKVRKRTCYGGSTKPCTGTRFDVIDCPTCAKSYSQRYTVRCGLFGWGRCTRYRTQYKTGYC